MFDILGGLFGQQDTPDVHVPSASELLGEVIGMEPQLAASTIAYNQKLGPAFAKIGREVEDIYDPLQGRLRETTTSNILDQLRLGGQLPPDVIQAITQNALERTGLAGTGLTKGGRNLVAKDLGLTSLDLLNQRIGRAADYTRSAPRPNELFRPQEFVEPGQMLGVAQGQHQLENQAQVMRSNIKSQNRSNLFGGILDLAMTGYGLANPPAGVLMNAAGGGGNQFGTTLRQYGGYPGMLA